MAGDSHSSHHQNPVHTFITPGVHTIRQTVQKSCNPDGDVRVRVTPAVLGILFNVNGTNTTMSTTTTTSGAQATTA